MKKRIAAVIPARMGASRFPGKPLVKILGLPMIEHVRRRVCMSGIVDETWVATCNREIIETVESFGGKAVMTLDSHERCTERVEEAARKIDADIIMIVQGDEPLFEPDVLEKLVEPMLKDDSVYCTNLFSKITDRKDLEDIDIVKVVLNNKGNAMYFSRSPIPFFRVDNNADCYRQTGVSAFTRDFLSKFTSLPPTRLEIAESVDFLRILEHGYDIRGVVISQETCGVDREEDVAIIEDRLKNNPVQKKLYERIIKS